jgi:mRNA-degrading endonuclease RelE of RelBE toxin-antitoxin system
MGFGFNSIMSMLEQVEEQVKRLSTAEQEALRDWLDNMLEDGLEFTDAFKAKIERGEQDISAGRVRIHKP